VEQTARRTRRPRTAILGTVIIGISLLVAACDKGMEGTFQDELGVMRYDFKSDGKVEMTVMGATVVGDYEMDGDHITVTGPHGQIGLERSGNILKGPMGLVLSPVAGS